MHKYIFLLIVICNLNLSIMCIMYLLYNLLISLKCELKATVMATSESREGARIVIEKHCTATRAYKVV